MESRATNPRASAAIWQIAILIGVSLFVLATPAAAQFTGTWTGPYEEKHPEDGGCIFSRGFLTLALNQIDTVVRGTVTIDLRNGDCEFQQPTVFVMPVTGNVAGSVLTASGIYWDVEEGKRFTYDFRATLSGTTIAFRTTDGAWIATMPQTSSTPPDNAATGSYGGTYNLLSVNASCSDPTLRSFADSGPASGSVFQTGTHLYALLIFNGVRTVIGPTSCAVQEKDVVLEFLTLTVTGTSVVGTTYSATPAVNGDVYSGTFNGTTLFLRHEGDGFIEFTIALGAAALPSVTSFAANPTGITTGSSTTLSWVTANATAVSISGGVGSVPTSGTVTVKPATTTTYTLTATGPGGPAVTAQTTVTVTPPSPPSITTFTASPASITAGGSTTLSWVTANATTVSINGGVGSVPTSGTRMVTPTATTTYVLTATGPGGPAVTAQTTVTVIPATPSNVVVSAFPRGMLQFPGSSLPASPYDRYTLRNIGGTATNITLTQSSQNGSGDFFVQSPTSFTLAPGGSQLIVIRSSPQLAGTYFGSSHVAGDGVTNGLTIPIRLFVALSAPTAALTVVPSAARRDLTAPAGQNPSGTVSFTNSSNSSSIEGLITADVPWIVPSQSGLFLGPLETKQLAFTIDRSKRPDADAPIGGVTGSLSFRYVNVEATTGNVEVHAATPVLTTVSVVIVDVVTVTPTAGSVPPIPPGQVALFLTGASSRLSSFGDLTLSNSGTSTISNLQVYFSPLGGAPGQFITIGQFPASAGIAFPGVLKNIFALESQTGSLHVRGDVSKVAAVQTQTDAARGQSYTLPVLRSDQSFGPGEEIYLPGVQGSPTATTTLYVQEMSNQQAAIEVDLIDAQGTRVGVHAPAPFNGALEIENVVPAGVVMVRVRNTSSAARINGYALVIDNVTNDAFTIVQSSVVTDPMICPAFAYEGGELLLHLSNTSDGPINVGINTVSAGTRRRTSTQSADRTLTATNTVTVAPHGYQQVRVTDSGFVRVTGTFVRVTATTSVPKNGGRIGSGVAVLPTSRGLAINGSRRFAGVEDSVSTSPLTYRTNLMLVETAGKSANVRLTLHVTFSAGKVSGSASVLKEISVPAGNFTLVDDLAEAMIGHLRSELGDLHNVILDVEVIGGAGSVIPFLQVIDNGTGDVTIRHE